MESHEERLRRLFGTPEFRLLEGALSKACEDNAFAEDLLVHDRARDWQVVRAVGEYLLLTSPDLLIGYVMIARASRHLGMYSEMRGALQNCRRVIPNGNESAMELRVLVPIIEAEEQALLSDRDGE